MKFKVGDIVTVKKDLIGCRFYGNVYFSPYMKKYRGGLYKISENVEGDKYLLEGCDGLFNDEMLEEDLEIIKIKGVSYS